MFRIPGIVVSNLAATGERGSIVKAKKQNCSDDCRKPCVKNPHACLPPRWKTMYSQRQRLSGTRMATSHIECPDYVRRINWTSLRAVVSRQKKAPGGPMSVVGQRQT